MNLLSQRIKEAKRELTALKTSHRRGLGTLKVYYASYSPSRPTSSGPFAILDVKVNFEGIAYPLVGMFPRSTDPTEYWAGTLFGSQPDFNYSNNGYTAEFEMSALVTLSDMYRFYVYSTSPIKSITYTWRDS